MKLQLTLASLLLALSLNAASYSQTVTVPLQMTDVAANLPINQFPPSLGTLTGVSLKWKYSVHHIDTIHNNSTLYASAYGMTYDADVELSWPDGSDIVAASYTDPRNGTLTPGGTFTADKTDSDADALSTFAGDFTLAQAAFVGTGVINFTYEASAYISDFGYNSIQSSHYAYTEAELTVTYTYEEKRGCKPPPHCKRVCQPKPPKHCPRK